MCDIMAFEVAPEQSVASSVGSPDSSSPNDIDRLLSEILNDPNVFSLIDSPSSSSSSAPSPPCYSPSPQQLEQEALASLGQQQQLYSVPEHCLADAESLQYCVPETPSPTTPSSSTEDHQAFFPSSSSLSSLPTPSHLSHPPQHPTSLPLHQTTPYSHQITPQLHSPSILQNVEVIISANIHDSYLRGQHGKITSVHQGIARVLVFNLNQECQVQRGCVDFVRPTEGDLVRVMSGPLAGVTGWFYKYLGELSLIQLSTGHIAEVATKSVGKLAADGGTPITTCNSPNPLPSSIPSPLPSPTSPSLVPATCDSPLLSPASLQNRHYSMLSCPPYSPNATGSYLSNSNQSPYSRLARLTTSSSFLSNSNHLNGSSYLRDPRQARLSMYCGTNGMRASRQHSRGQLTELQRRRYQEFAYRQVLRCHTGAGQDNVQHFLQNCGSGIQAVGKHPAQDSISPAKYTDRPTQEMVEEVRGRKMLEYDFSSTGDGKELTSSSIQVPLICPLSQKRMSLPCRGLHCKHPQCFDAEAYIEFNKCVMRPKDKDKSGCHVFQSIKPQLFKCPLCSKDVPFSQLCVDRTMLQILQDTDQDEVEFDKTGSWKPVEKKSPADDVIDLTEDGDSSP